MKKVGIENLVVIVGFILGLGNKVGEALEDGKVSFAETMGLLPELIKLPTALKALPEAAHEIQDLDMEERQELERIIAQKFQIVGKENIENLIEQSLFLALNLAIFVKSLQALKQAKN